MAAIRTTGNVFCYEAISELNIKTKNFKDLLNSEPFTRKDIVVLQDPQDTSKNNLNSFHHLKNNFKVRIHFFFIIRLDEAYCIAYILCKDMYSY